MARVVVVDDDDAFLYVLQRRLVAAGHEVVGFSDWVGVLELLDTDLIVDALVTDLRLPPGTPNGQALGRMARLKRPRLNVIYMTAFADLVVEMRQSMPDIVLKSADAANIVAAISKAVAA